MPHIDMIMVIATKETIAILVMNGTPIAKVTAADRQVIDSASLSMAIVSYLCIRRR